MGKRSAISAAFSRWMRSTSSMDGSDPVGAGLHLSQRLLVQWARGPDRAVEKHGGEREHVVACLAVEAGALAARVRVDHAADRGAVGGGELGGEEQAVRV